MMSLMRCDVIHGSRNRRGRRTPPIWCPIWCPNTWYLLVLVGTYWEATSRQVVYEALCSDLELLAQPAMSAGTTS